MEKRKKYESQKIVINYRGTIIEGVIAGSHIGDVIILDINKDLIDFYAKKDITIPKSIKVQHVSEGITI